jgi:hypothetical protein
MGAQSKLKEMIDVCHQNGIAVILDVALNHAFGRNPMVEWWMNDLMVTVGDLLQLKVLILIQLLSIVIT